MTLEQTIAAAVRSLLAVRGESQRQLAAVLGVTPGAVSHRMKGQTPWTSRDLEALARHFRVSYAALVSTPPEFVTGSYQTSIDPAAYALCA